MTDPTPEPQNGATFTPLDDDGHPNGPPRYVTLAAPVEVTYADDGHWVAAAARARDGIGSLSDSLRSVGIALANVDFGPLYDFINSIGAPYRTPRAGKAARARAKRAKLHQRRAARAQYGRAPGVDWRAAAPLLRKSIASIARDGVPCSPVPCPPFTTSRMRIEPITIGGDE